MNIYYRSKLKLISLGVIVVLLTLLPLLVSAEHEYEDQQEGPAFSQAELDQMLAPIALYPDSLLLQILMASTYPLEVVEAARWSRAHHQPEGDRAVRGVESKRWDPSVKSLVAVPRVLLMMDDKLIWTEQLGEAFLAQKEDVMGTVQDLRRRALRENHFSSSEHVRVVDQGGYIIIEPVNPQVIYVPYYSPLVVYGDWWWPAYQPVYWDPWPGYYHSHHHHGVTSAVLWGSHVSVSVGFFFGTPDWHRRDVYITHTNNYYYPHTTAVVYDSHHPHHSSHIVDNTPRVWRHEAVHRGGATYHKEVLSQRYASPDRSPTSTHRQQTHEPSLARQPQREHPATGVQNRRELSRSPRDGSHDQPHRNREQPIESAPVRRSPREHSRPQRENTPAVIRQHRQDQGTPTPQHQVQPRRHSEPQPQQAQPNPHSEPQPQPHQPSGKPARFGRNNGNDDNSGQGGRFGH